MSSCFKEQVVSVHWKFTHWLALISLSVFPTLKAFIHYEEPAERHKNRIVSSCKSSVVIPRFRSMTLSVLRLGFRVMRSILPIFSLQSTRISYVVEDFAVTTCSLPPQHI